VDSASRLHGHKAEQAAYATLACAGARQEHTGVTPDQEFRTGADAWLGRCCFPSAGSGPFWPSNAIFSAPTSKERQDS